MFGNDAPFLKMIQESKHQLFFISKQKQNPDL